MLCCGTQERLVAMGGKLVTLKSQAGEAPNGKCNCCSWLSVVLAYQTATAAAAQMLLHHCQSV
jgi:hypothetical protein